MRVFLFGGKDFMQDFFNVQIYIANMDPWFNEINGPGEKPYFPIAYLFYKAFSCGVDYSQYTDFREYWENGVALSSALLFTLVQVAAFFHSLRCLKPDLKPIQAFVITFSSVFLFTIERGNLTLLTAAFVCYFLAYYKSESTKLRVFALTSLCIAATLKIFPVFFGLLLLKDRKWNEIACCVIGGVVIALLPFIFFKHGFENLPKLYSNIMSNSDHYGVFALYPRFGIAPSVAVVLRFLRVSEPVMDEALEICKLTTYALTLLSVWVIIRSKNRNTVLFLTACIVTMLPANSALYCGVYWFPVLLLLKGTFDKREDMMIAVFFLILLCPIEYFRENKSVNCVLMNAWLTLTWGYVISQAVFSRIVSSNRQKTHKVEFDEQPH